MNVIHLAPDTKPQVGSLTDRLHAAIADYAEQGHVTYAEVIGALEIVKHDQLKELKEE